MTDIQFLPSDSQNDGAIVLLVSDKLSLSKAAEALDKKASGILSNAIKNKAFKGKKGEVLSLIAPNGIKASHLVLAGCGKAKELSDLVLTEIGGAIMGGCRKLPVPSLSIVVSLDEKTKFSNDEKACLIGLGIKLRSYEFDKYKTKDQEDKIALVPTANLLVDDPKKAALLYKEQYQPIADGVFFARDVVTEPPNILYPKSYADRCLELEADGVEVRILGEKEMEQLGMGALLGVGQGSIRDSRLVVMRYFGDPKGKNEAPVAFVGKGVTFDTGGISLKPAAGMEDMKYDMGGSAAVVGVMRTLARRKAKINAVGVIGLVENMPGHNAQRPSDVVTSMSGQTIEVLNTDAEGRLVLADALWYTQDNFHPKYMVNLATLTGAIVIALGTEYAGLFSNNDALSAMLSKAGEDVGEKLWRFPLAKAYDKLMDSPIADMQNISSGKGAGSITAAQFLQRFVNNVPWAHLDIAGMAWTKTDQDICPKGAVGFGVRVLDRFVRNECEK